MLLEIKAEYGIDLKQVLSITADNGSNMLAMVKEVEHLLLQMHNGFDDRMSPGCQEQLSPNETQSSSNDENIDNDTGRL